MPSPIDPKDAMDVFSIAKSSWQWLVGGVASGAYGVWKYLNARIRRLEETLVTAEQLSVHTKLEDSQFSAILGQNDRMREQLIEIGKHLEVIIDNVKDIRRRQAINEDAIEHAKEDLASIKERHRIEEHQGALGRRDYDERLK